MDHIEGIKQKVAEEIRASTEIVFETSSVGRHVGVVKMNGERILRAIIGAVDEVRKQT